MTTLTRTYATEVAARRAVEELRATGLAERSIRLLVGSAPRDIRRDPVVLSGHLAGLRGDARLTAQSGTQRRRPPPRARVVHVQTAG